MEWAVALPVSPAVDIGHTLGDFPQERPSSLATQASLLFNCYDSKGRSRGVVSEKPLTTSREPSLCDAYNRPLEAYVRRRTNQLCRYPAWTLNVFMGFLSFCSMNSSSITHIFKFMLRYIRCMITNGSNSVHQGLLSISLTNSLRSEYYVSRFSLSLITNVRRIVWGRGVSRF